MKSNQQEFESFRERANREYAEFMRKRWEWFEGKEPVAPPVQEEPVVPPVVVPEEDLDKDREEKEIPYGEVVPEPEPVPAPMPIEPVEDVPAPVVNTLSFELYGTDCMVRFDKDKRPFLSNVSENSIADLWEAFGFTIRYTCGRKSYSNLDVSGGTCKMSGTTSSAYTEIYLL